MKKVVKILIISCFLIFELPFIVLANTTQTSTNNIAVTDVVLNKTSDVLTIGNSDTLEATVNPSDATDKTVNWASSNTGVVTVDDAGKITAVSAGSAIITVTTTDSAKTATCNVTVNPITVSYTTDVQDRGWQGTFTDGQVAGTTGQSLRIEALKINLVNAPNGASIKYQAHVQNVGWQSPAYDGGLSGTTGQALRIEAIKISLVNLPGYSVIYRAHVQNIGWQPWTEDGSLAGTEGLSLRIEAIQIKIVKTVNIQYQVHVQNKGWESPVSNGTITGTDGQPLRIEAVDMKLTDAPAGAYIQYEAHVQNIGWQDWTKEGDMAGTVGKSLRIEALRIKLVNLPGYSVQYQVFVQNIGWQPWVSDGQDAGTFGRSLRIEGLRVRIIGNPDGSTTPPIVQPAPSITKTTSYRLAAYLDSNENIASVQAAAIALHYGITSNNCVYFSSEAMRRIGYKVPLSTANTRQYVPYLKSLNLFMNKQRALLTSGSICFTINDSTGYPTHTFLFLGWVNPDDHTSAYVIDNQSHYIHIRSMLNTDITDAFAFSFHS